MLLFVLLAVASFPRESLLLPEMRKSEPLSTGSAGDCPRTCLCNALSRIVYCSRRGMTLLPRLLPVGTLQLNVNGNVFASPILRRSNFSGYADRFLEHLYMSECGIEELEPSTFADLYGLRWLDVSNNRLRRLERDTFRDLSLEHLFLNGNREIEILPDSFHGLVTTGLYLHDCLLSSLAPEALHPVRSGLRSLWLNGNRLEKVDRGLLEVFSTLHHLRLGSNPLLCNCDVIWLKEFFDNNEEIFRGALPPTCAWPAKLRARHFSELDVELFRCRVPMFSRVEAFFNDSQIRLNCRATGDPAPSLYWIQPSGSASRYSPPADLEVQENEGVLVIGGDQATSQRGMYICIANNDAGNVTLTIDIPNSVSSQMVVPPGPGNGKVTPHSERVENAVVSVRVVGSHSTTGGLSTYIPPVLTSVRSRMATLVSPNFGSTSKWSSASGSAGTISTWTASSDQETEENLTSAADSDQDEISESTDATLSPVLHQIEAARSFSLMELLGTVLVTHVCTVVGCLAASWVCCRRGFRDKRESTAVGTVRDSVKRSPEFAYWSGTDSGHLRFVDYLANVTPTRR